MAEPVQITLKIINEKGLHARASAKLVETVEQFEAEALVSKDGMEATGDSIMGLLMLGASRGTSIDVRITGTQASELAEALQALVSDYFGEGM
ncbi:MAG: HPr family phosphocarrier protein [Rhodobacteraceae bacterium]|nr:HPr family phosphocarrier protein [Paracoccaceae bacterium]